MSDPAPIRRRSALWGVPFALLAAAGVWVVAAKASARPEGLALRLGAHQAAPVVLKSLQFDGRGFSATDGLVLSYGWTEPRGGMNLLLTLPPAQGAADDLTISAEWVDLFGGEGWRAAITISVRDLNHFRDSRRSVDVILLFGTRGRLMVATVDPSRPGEGRDIAETCGTRATELDRIYRPGDPEVLVYDVDMSGQGQPAPDSPCR